MLRPPPTSLAGIEASTSGLKVLLSGFELFPSLVKKILVERGILEPGEDGPALMKERWFPIEAWLAVHETIFREMGPGVIRSVGARIVENPNFPPGARDLVSALSGLDLAYLASHRKYGARMYDRETGQTMEGIGHYRMKYVSASQRRAEMVCDTPYLCDVDSSIIRGLSQKFEPKARVDHAPGGCRKTGAPACTYVVTW